MTATMERAATVTVTTLDGESRDAVTCPDGSWSCPFCSGANFPLGHEHHRDYGWAGACGNPMCIAGGAMTEAGTADYRKRQAEHQQREDDRKAREDAEQAKRDRAAQIAADRLACRSGLRADAVQLGFAWACFKAEDAPECASGYDQAEYAAHMKAHGARALSPSVKPVRLRRKAPVAKMPALEVNVFKWARWHQEHTEPGVCECGHGTSGHRCGHTGFTGTDGKPANPGCDECPCTVSAYDIKRIESAADRRGQYLANGPGPHSVWVIPFEAAPWETGTAAPVLLYAGKTGRYFTDSCSAKYDRR